MIRHCPLPHQVEVEMLRKVDRRHPVGQSVHLPGQTPTLQPHDNAEVHFSGIALIAVLRHQAQFHGTIAIWRHLPVAFADSARSTMQVMRRVIDRQGICHTVHHEPRLRDPVRHAAADHSHPGRVLTVMLRFCVTKHNGNVPDTPVHYGAAQRQDLYLGIGVPQHMCRNLVHWALLRRT